MNFVTHFAIRISSPIPTFMMLVGNDSSQIGNITGSTLQ
ncbi:hypothetical protein MED222_06090 [Vibrio sp. MED222]|nr:hypothetical protein MED222_06090 [Vibrio sp. MED222]